MEHKIKAIIADQLGCKFEEVTNEVTLENLGADSLDKFELMLELELEFEIEITDEETEGIETVGQVVEFIMRKKGI